MAGIKRINAVFIYVSDMEKERRFYEEILGLGKPVVETDLWVEYELTGSNLALHQGDARILEQQDASRNTVKFSLEVDDLEGFCRDLKERGVSLTFGPRKDFGSFLAECRDPEGNLIRLIEFSGGVSSHG